MVANLKVVLDQVEYSALLEVAIDELRNPPDQARYIIRNELVRRGLLTNTDKGQKSNQSNEVIKNDK